MWVESVKFSAGTCHITFADKGETVHAVLTTIRALGLAQVQTPLAVRSEPSSCGPFDLESLGVRFVAVVCAQLPGKDDGQTVLIPPETLTALIEDLRAVVAATQAANSLDQAQTFIGTWRRESPFDDLKRQLIQPDFHMA